MKRREFLRLVGLGLAGACAGGQFSQPREATAARAPEVRLAFLADAHLQDGAAHRPEARALARAVAELSALQPAPQLVLFAGDLAHNGDPTALALGQEILSDLPVPCLMLMGEGDGLPDAATPWRRLFGDPWFSHAIKMNFNDDISESGVASRPLPKTGNRKPETLQLIGVHTGWCPGPGGPVFRVGGSGRRWLARELDRLDPEVPLLLLSHAPLEPGFRPWQQWTLDGPEVLSRLSQFRRVLCLHGHTHNAGGRGQGPEFNKKNDLAGLYTENRKPETENLLLSLSLPSTAWPGPQALQGTPAILRPGFGPSGCGWGLLSGCAASLEFQPQTWQA